LNRSKDAPSTDVRIKPLPPTLPPSLKEGVSAYNQEHDDVVMAAKEVTALGTKWLHVNCA
jgi:hypothetical protein